MNNLYYAIILTIVATISIDYALVQADNAAASASASASASAAESAPVLDSVVEETPVMNEQLVNLVEPEEEILTDSILLFKQGLQNEVEKYPDLFDRADVEAVLMDPDSIYATQFLNQRSGNWARAYKLAVQTLRWRADLGLNQLQPYMFPCDLFTLGLIFEHGYTHQLDENGAYVPGNPVIWIRLGALGSVIKQLEKFTGKRLASFAINYMHAVGNTARNLGSKLVHPGRKQVLPAIKRASVAPSPRKRENLSVKNERTISHVLKSIAWWLDDWQRSHAPGSQATLVLDFESTDFALSSTSMSEFLMNLDDHFPDLFDQIIGYRYKSNFIRSIHSPLSLFNKIFSARIKSSPETDKKVKFVNREADISAYMPRVDSEGFTMLPDYISGKKSLCKGPIHAPPEGCQTQLDDSNDLYDPLIWQAIHNEFYQKCKPQQRV